jgi:hypothetical protein
MDTFRVVSWLQPLTVRSLQETRRASEDPHSLTEGDSGSTVVYWKIEPTGTVKGELQTIPVSDSPPPGFELIVPLATDLSSDGPFLAAVDTRMGDGQWVEARGSSAHRSFDLGTFLLAAARTFRSIGLLTQLSSPAEGTHWAVSSDGLREAGRPAPSGTTRVQYTLDALDRSGCSGMAQDLPRTRLGPSRHVGGGHLARQLDR